MHKLKECFKAIKSSIQIQEIGRIKNVWKIFRVKKLVFFSLQKCFGILSTDLDRLF